jgi:hypothetical protein
MVYWGAAWLRTVVDRLAFHRRVGAHGVRGHLEVETFTVTSAAGASFVYGAAANHDIDRESNGTVIRIRRP